MQPSYPIRGRGTGRPSFVNSDDYELSSGVNEAKNKYFESMLNRKLYQSAKEVFENAPAQLLSSYSEEFLTGVQSHCDCPDTNYNLQRRSDCDFFFFEGYPSGDFLKQVSGLLVITSFKVCVVLSLWFKQNKFPVLFRPIESLIPHDETD
jgi:hypothetical protein